MHFFVAVLSTAREERGCTVEGCFQDVHSPPSGTHHTLVPKRNAQPEDFEIEIMFRVGFRILWRIDKSWNHNSVNGILKEFSTSSCLKEMSFWRRLVVWLDIWLIRLSFSST